MATAAYPGGGTTDMQTLEEEERKRRKEQEENAANNAGGGGGGAPVAANNSGSSLTTPLNSRPNYAGTYGNMVMVPKSTYETMMNSGRDPVQNLHQNLIRQQVEQAQKNANNPKKYQHYMVQANVLRRNTVANPNIDQRIKLALNDPHVQQIDAELHRLGRNKNLVKTHTAQKRYRSLQVDKNTRLNVLQNQENQRYSSLVNNPSDTTTPIPTSLANKSYHVNTLRSFLQRHPNLIRQDSSGHVYVENERVTSHAAPQNLSHILHYLTQDYETQRSLPDQEYAKQLPKGLLQFVRALHRRGFNYSDIGNKYLRDKLSTGGLMNTTPTAPQGARPRTTTTTTPQNRSQPSIQEKIQTVTRRLRTLEMSLHRENLSAVKRQQIREQINQNKNLYDVYRREFAQARKARKRSMTAEATPVPTTPHRPRFPTLTPTPSRKQRILPTPPTERGRHQRPHRRREPSPPTTPKPAYNLRHRGRHKKSSTDK